MSGPEQEPVESTSVGTPDGAGASPPAPTLEQTQVNPAIDATLAEPLTSQPTSPSSPGTVVVPEAKFSLVSILGQQIGPYRVIQELGAGGMGSVYLVEQKVPVRRQVALKLLHAGLSSPEMLQRFRAEGDALARMNHPNIAQIYDFSTAPDGRLYFAMEYVPGVPLVQFCKQRNLDVRQRVELFLQACEGVQHAHQKGMIHRDLKPTNLLVADYQGQLLVKVIDFGIAKRLEESGEAEVSTTLAGAPIGTPAYMSPEQAAGDPKEVDTRTDVYALGGVLYKLLTDELPISADQIHRAMQSGLAAFLRDAVIVPPSRSVELQGREPKDYWPKEMGGEYNLIARRLRGDLDWITLKALARERERRYASVSELAADLRRHLNGEAVLASPDSKSYRIRKFIARNRLTVAAGSAVVLSLIAGIIGTTQMAIEARDQRARAEVALKQSEADRERALATKAFLEQMIAAPDPWRTSGVDPDAKDVKVIEAIIAASNQVEGDFADDPGLRAEIDTLIGRTLRRLGQLELARGHLERAVSDTAKSFSPNAVQRVQAELELALLDSDAGRYREANQRLNRWVPQLASAKGLTEGTEGEALRVQSHVVLELGDADRAETLARDNLRRLMQRYGENSMEVFGAKASLADLLGGKGSWEQANALMDEAFAGARGKLGELHPKVIELLSLRGDLATREGKLDRAEAFYRDAAMRSEQVLGAEHKDTLRQWAHVALNLSDAGKHPEAAELFERMLPKREALLGADNPNVLTMRANYAQALRALDRKANAEAILRDVHTRRTRVLGTSHPETLRTLNLLAISARERDDLVTAEQLYREASEQYGKINGPNHPETIMMESNHIGALRDLGRLQEAIDAYARLLPRAEEALPQGHWHRAAIQGNYGVALMSAKRYAEAREFLRASWQTVSKQFPDTDPRVQKAKQRLDEAEAALKPK